MQTPAPRARSIALAIPLLSLALAAGPVFAASATDVTIAGTVRSSSGEPLGGAEVALVGTEIRALTDLSGRFLLDVPPGRCVLRASHPGYQAVTRPTEALANVDDLEFVLAPLPRFSDEVTVQAVRAEDTAPVTRSDLDARAIQAVNVGQEMPALLESSVPSLTQYSDTGLDAGYSYIFLRGIQQTRMNLTLDGVPLNEPEDSALYFVNFGDFASALQSIQVQRGVGTSAPGAASFVGSINFASIDLAEEPRLDARAGTGSFGTNRLALSAHSGTVGSDFRFFARAAYQETDGFKHHSGVTQRSIFFGATRQGEQSFFKLFGFAGHEHTQLAFLATDEATLQSDLRYNALTPEERDSFGQRFVQGQYHRAITATTGLSLQGYYNGAGGWYRLWEDPTTRATLLEYGLDWRSVGATVSLTHRRGPVSLTWGAHGNDFGSHHARDRVDGPPDYRNRGLKNEVSSFLKAGYDRGRWHHYGDVQVRWARFRYSGDVAIAPVSWTFLNPKIGTRMDLSPAFSLYASLGTARREPTRSDMFSGEDNPSVAYDPRAVRPERVADIEAGAEWHRPGLELQLAGYAMEFRDEIALTGELSEVGLPVRRNVDRSHRRGLELSLSWQPARALRVRHTAHLSAARIRSWQQVYDVYDADGAWLETTSVDHRDVRPLLTPAFVGSLSVDYAPLPWLSAGLSARGQTKAHLDNTGSTQYRTPGLVELDGTLNIGLERWISAGAPRLRVQASNLLDRRLFPSGYSYQFFTATPTGDLLAGGTRYFYPAATRAVFVALEVGR